MLFSMCAAHQEPGGRPQQRDSEIACSTQHFTSRDKHSEPVVGKHQSGTHRRDFISWDKVRGRTQPQDSLMRCESERLKIQISYMIGHEKKTRSQDVEQLLTSRVGRSRTSRRRWVMRGPLGVRCTCPSLRYGRVAAAAPTLTSSITSHQVTKHGRH